MQLPRNHTRCLVWLCTSAVWCGAAMADDAAPTKANSDFISGSGIPADNFTVATDGTVSTFVKARGRDTGQPLSISGSTYRVLTGQAASMPGTSWFVFDFQFTPGEADAAGAPNYTLELRFDTDPSAATSFISLPAPIFDGDADPLNSWDDTDGFFLNPGPGAWSDDAIDYVYSQSWRPDFTFLAGSILGPGLYDIELIARDTGGTPLATSSIRAEVVPAELQLVAQDDCLDASESQLVVDVLLSGSELPVTGGQYLLSYDAATLDFVSADPGDAPFTLEIIEVVDEGAGKIRLATGVALGGVGTEGPAVMARLTFDVIGDVEFCAAADLVTFRSPDVGEQPTRLTDALATEIIPATLDLGPVENDNTPPELTIPADIVVNADAGTCEAVLGVGFATATDNCTDVGDLAILGVRSDTLSLTDPYPAGITTITWTATDACGNETVGVQSVDVAGVNTVVAEVEIMSLDSVICLDGTIESAEWGGFLSSSVGVPCGTLDWDGPPDWTTGSLGPYVYADAGVSATVTVADIDGISLPAQPDDDNPFGVPAMWLAGNFNGTFPELVLTVVFDQPVYDLSFSMYDIDNKGASLDSVEVVGRLGAAGSPELLSGVSTGSGVDYDGLRTFTANGTSNGNPPNPADAAALTIPGPLDRVSITYTTNATGVGILIGNMDFRLGAGSGCDTTDVYAAWGDDGLYLAFDSSDGTDGRVTDEDDALRVNLGLAGNAVLAAWAQGFESGTSGWLDQNSAWNGLVTQVPSGTGGITSASGASHAIFQGGGGTAPFSRFDGYRSAWVEPRLVASVDVYLDPAWAPGEGFDYSVAANGTDGNHQRDFIFHVTKDTSSGRLLVAGSNNTNFAAREDLDTLGNNYEITVAGWYTLEHLFRDAGDGSLAVDLNLYDSGGTLLFTETRNDPADTLGIEVGGNRYAWFTFISVTGGIGVDNHTLTVPGGADWRYQWSNESTGAAGDPVGDTVDPACTPCDYFGAWKVGDDAVEADDSTGAPSGLTDIAPGATGIIQRTSFDSGRRQTELFIPNGALFDDQNNWARANRALVRLMGELTSDTPAQPLTFPSGGNFADQSTYLAPTGVIDGIERCITFELLPAGGGPLEVVSDTVEFIRKKGFNSAVGTAFFEVDCGDYECITARDTLHTLKSKDSDDFMILGTSYSADFTSMGAIDNDALVGGNANDDSFIDILDFGLFSGQFGSAPGEDTPCGTPAFHTDFSGDGVVGIEDFSFIQINFFAQSEPDCAPGLLRVSGPTQGGAFESAQIAGRIGGVRPLGPVRSITVGELHRRGLSLAAAGDLNDDGVLDQDDMRAFALGGRPAHLADLNDDDRIDIDDVLVLIEAYGEEGAALDIDADGEVGVDDLRFVLDRLGRTLTRP